jgi:D-threo-aldose 1-dehydrogenase
MKRKPIGTTGLDVTSLCFGTSGLGSMPDNYGYPVGEEQAYATLRAIFDGPVNILDTSRNYGFGRSEERIGTVLREMGGLPDGFVLSTKLDRDRETGRLDAARARQSLEESLKTLGLDRIQVLHLHDPEYCRNIEEITGAGGALDELFKMKEEGLAQAVGLAMGRLDMMFPILKSYPFDTLISHNRFTLLNRAADEIFDYAHAQGMAIFNAAPYAGGVLAKGSATMPRLTYKEVDDAALAPVRRIEEICARYGIAPGAAALWFSLNDPRITATICGVSKPERVTQTLDWAATQIPQEAKDALLALPFSTEDPQAKRE